MASVKTQSILQVLRRRIRLYRFSNMILPKARPTWTSMASILKRRRNSGTMKTQSKLKRSRRAKQGSIEPARSEKRSGRQSSPTGKTESASSQSAAQETPKSLLISTEEFDRRFDAGESLDSLGVDLSKAKRPGKDIKRITIDLPAPFLDRLDHWAAVRGLTRQALVKSWLYDRLEKQSGL